MTAIRASTMMINTVSRPPIRADVSIKTAIVKYKFNSYKYVSITLKIHIIHAYCMNIFDSPISVDG